jgi:hypothetical protein
MSSTALGKIGIGISSPSSKLHVMKNTSGLIPNSNSILTVENDDNTYLNLLSTSESGLLFGGNGNATNGAITYNSPGFSNSLSFRTNNNTNRMVISSTGNIAIGSFIPNHPLHFESVLGSKICLYGGSANNYGFGIQSGLLQMYSDAATDDIGFGYGSSAFFTENMRIKGNGLIGIGNSSPNAKLQIDATNQLTPLVTDGLIIPRVPAFPSPNPGFPQNGMLLYLTTTIGTKVPGFYYWDNFTTSWIAVGSKSNWSLTGNSGTNATTNFIGTTDNNDVSIKTNNTEVVHLTTTGKVGIGIATPAAELEVNGYTKLGSSAPAVKLLKFTGTTNSAQGGTTSFLHGVNSSKILAVNVLVDFAAGSSIPPSYNANPGYEYDYYITSTTIIVWNKASNSSNILSKPIRILVTYEQ